MHVVDIHSKILEENNKLANENWRIFKEHAIFAVNLMSAPGAGKTSLLEQTIIKLKHIYNISVIEGDLQTSIDADRIRQLDVSSVQIITGSVCHLDARMIQNTINKIPLAETELLFIENVGNLVCPAEFYLGEDLKVMVFSVVEGEEKPIKYPFMFHEADAVILNKIDLIEYSGIELYTLVDNVFKINPAVEIFPVSCRNGDGIIEWTNWLRSKVKFF